LFSRPFGLGLGPARLGPAWLTSARLGSSLGSGSALLGPARTGWARPRLGSARFHNMIEHFLFEMAHAPPNHPPPQPKSGMQLDSVNVSSFLNDSPFVYCLKFGSSKGCIKIALDLFCNILNADTFQF
jgi:hypothetical protein